MHRRRRDDPFDGNHSLWSPAADALCLAARLAREAGDRKAARSLVQRIVDNPAFTSNMSQRDFRSWIAAVDKDLRDARAEKSATWARVGAHGAVTRACYFRETAGYGFYYERWLDPAALDASISQAIELLRVHLAGKR